MKVSTNVHTMLRRQKKILNLTDAMNRHIPFFGDFQDNVEGNAQKLPQRKTRKTIKSNITIGKKPIRHHERMLNLCNLHSGGISDFNHLILIEYWIW